jgi:hypothetical protein
MDTQPPEPPPGHAVFDPVLTGVDDALAEAERQVGAVLKSVPRLRRAAQKGDISGLPRQDRRCGRQHRARRRRAGVHRRSRPAVWPGPQKHLSGDPVAMGPGRS